MKGWHKDTPQLHPPIRGWVQDLPGPNDPVGESMENMPLKMRINAINDIYLEIPRTRSLTRFGWAFGIGTLIPLAAISIYMLLFLCFGPNDGSFNLNIYLVVGGGMLIMLLAAGGGAWYFNLYLRHIPRVEALRFNRITQKVYACGSVVHLFPPRIERRYSECDWADLRAELFKFTGATPYGVFTSYYMMLSVVNSETNVVIERLKPAFMDSISMFEWEAIRRYMQQGPEAIPPANRKIADPNASRNIFMRMALPITWPADLDFLSRSAPGRPAKPEDPKYIAQLVSTSKRYQWILYSIAFAISAAWIWLWWQVLPLWK